MKYLKEVILVLATIVVSMVGFWFVEGREYATRAEVKEIVNTAPFIRRADLIEAITTQTPYVLERPFIMKSLADRERSDDALLEAVQGLKIQMAVLNTTLENLSKKLEQSM